MSNIILESLDYYFMKRKESSKLLKPDATDKIKDSMPIMKFENNIEKRYNLLGIYDNLDKIFTWS